MADSVASPAINWLGLPVVATVAQLLCRELTLHNEYLRVENKVLRSKLSGRISCNPPPPARLRQPICHASRHPKQAPQIVSRPYNPSDRRGGG